MLRLVRGRTIVATASLYVNCHARGKRGGIRRRLSFKLCPKRLADLLKTGKAKGSALLHALSTSRPSLTKSLRLLNGPLRRCSRGRHSHAVNMILASGARTKKLAICRLMTLKHRPRANFFKQLRPGSRLVVGRTLSTMNVTRGTRDCATRLSSKRQRGMVVTGTLIRRYPLVVLSRPATFLSIIDHVRVVALLRRLTIRRGGTVLLSARSVRRTLMLSSGL